MTILNGNYKEYIMDNGLKVALQNTSTQTVAAKLIVNYASYHEKEGEEGLAHYLEHCLVSGGSEKFDPISADNIRASFGHYNAYTGLNATSFIGNMLSEDVEQWLDYVSDHVFRPRFDDVRINAERQRVLREISDNKSNSEYKTNRQIADSFFRGHPGGKFILGNESVVENATFDIMKKFHGRGYHPNNMSLILVGGIENIDEVVKKYFGSILQGENTKKEFPLLPFLDDKVVIKRHAEEKRNVDNPNESTADIRIQYVGPIEKNDDVFAFSALNKILGGGSDSLLFENVSLKRGLAYRIRTFSHTDFNAGVYGVNASIPSRRQDEAIDAIFEEFNRMKEERVPQSAVAKINKLLKYAMAKAYETNEGHINAIEAKWNIGITPEEFIAGFDKVTPEKILEVANKYLPDREQGKYLMYVADPLLK